jgi:hypothetical protein
MEEEDLKEIALVYIGRMTPEEFFETFRDEVTESLVEKLKDEDFHDFVKTACGDDYPFEDDPEDS